MFCHQVGTGWPRHPELKSHRPAPSHCDHVPSLVWRGLNFVSNIFWRTRMPHTNNAAMYLPRMASVAPMRHQKWKEKMGKYEKTSYKMRCLVCNEKPNSFLNIYNHVFRVTFCTEHARRNAMAVRAQMRKATSAPSPEALLSQLSGYSRAETQSHDESCSDASRVVGKWSCSDWEMHICYSC